MARSRPQPMPCNWRMQHFTPPRLHNHVRFTHDGERRPPSIQANDGSAVNNLTRLCRYHLVHQRQRRARRHCRFSDSVEGGTVPLTPAERRVTDPDSSSFTFTATNESPTLVPHFNRGGTGAREPASRPAIGDNHVAVHDRRVAPTLLNPANDGSAVTTSVSLCGSVFLLPSQ